MIVTFLELEKKKSNVKSVIRMHEYCSHSFALHSMSDALLKGMSVADLGEG